MYIYIYIYIYRYIVSYLIRVAIIKATLYAVSCFLIETIAYLINSLLTLS